MNVIEGVLSDIDKLKKRAALLETQGYSTIPKRKITASTITLTTGTSANAVADLRTASDGLFYTLREAAATPGMVLDIYFTSVTAFHWVNIIGAYAGSATHAVAIQMYNWTTAAFNTFNAFQNGMFDITTAGGYILSNYQFLVPDYAPYIGTGASLGQVDVRFYHTMAGNASHYLYIDVVALYR